MESMKNVKVRINKISLWDFKNVTYGVIRLNSVNAQRDDKADIMGIYGQNASGKTAVIEALAIIKDILTGYSIDSRFWNVIASSKDECTIEVELSIIDDDENLDSTAIYKCSLGLRNDPNDSSEKPRKIMAIIRESLRARGSAYDEKFILQDILIVDENQHSPLPKDKYVSLVGKNHDTLNFLMQQKILALYGSRSFIFSRQIREAIGENIRLNSEKMNALVAWSIRLLMSTGHYALTKLFIIDDRTEYDISFHVITSGLVFGVPLNVDISQRGDTGIVKELVDVVENVIPHINNVLSSITPGLSLECKVAKKSLDENDDSYRLEFFSNREGFGTFPFENESLGIKKIISFVVLLIEAYNNPSFTLAIDEMDAGVFEFLFGEILDIMGNSGKGQLIFTSHNLRPLERLNPRFVCFTTTDPENRYVQMNKKATNNLRDMYIRALQLGYEGYELYNGENKHSLAHAFRKMGRYSE